MTTATRPTAPQWGRPQMGPRNEAAHHYKLLAAAVSVDAAHQRVDVHAANLAAVIARQGRTAVAFIPTNATPRHQTQAFILDGYGIVLRRKRWNAEYSVLTASVKRRTASEFCATVTARQEEAA